MRHPLPATLLCALLWGSAFPGIKIIYDHWSSIGLERTLPLILFLAGLRFTLAGAGLLLFSTNLASDVQKTGWGKVLLLALFQTFLQYFFFYQAIAVSSASLTSLLVASGSLWWMILSPFFQKGPRPSRFQWFAVLLGGCGVTLAVFSPGAGAGRPLLGAILMLTATASGTLAILTFGRMSSTMSARNATGLALLIGGLALFFCGLPALSQLPQILSGPVLPLTLGLAAVSAIAFSLWNHLSTRFPVPVLASYRFLIPICGVLEAFLFLPQEFPGPGFLIGTPLVLVSMILIGRRQNLIS